MSKLVKNIQKKRALVLTLGFSAIWSVVAFADQVDKISQTIASYAAKGGGILAFIGALMAVSGYKSDNPAEMDRGIKTVIAGAAVMAIAKGYNAWIA